MVSTKDPVLIIWDAINLLAEVNVRLNAPGSTQRILAAERVLLNLMLDLWRSTGQGQRDRLAVPGQALH